MSKINRNKWKNDDSGKNNTDKNILIQINLYC